MRLVYWSALVVVLVAVSSCIAQGPRVASLSVDYPHGERRLLVESGGEASLFYGALPRGQRIGAGVFSVDELYAQLRARLHENVPRDRWPDPMAEYGMVTIVFDDRSERSYLLFDEKAFAEALFGRAEAGIVSAAP